MSRLERAFGCTMAAMVVSVVATACGDDGAVRSTATVRDSAGITIVTNTQPTWTEVDAWRIADSPRVDIGVVAGEEPYELFQPLGVVLLSDGRIVVANRGSRDLRYFDAGGRHLVTVGGRGGGPGEFADLSWFGRAEGDSVIVFDRRNLRISVFDPAGRFARSHSIDPVREARHPVTGEIVPVNSYPFIRGRLRGGSYVAHVWHGRLPGEPSEPLGRGRDSLMVTRYDAQGELRDTLAVLLRRVRHGHDIDIRGRTRRAATTVPFTPAAMTVGHGDQVFVGSTDEYEVRVLSDRGDLRTVVRKVHQRRPVRARDTQLFMDSLHVLWDNNPEGQLVLEMLDATPPLDSMPAYESLLVDVEGNLWVADTRPPNTPRPSWNVFDGDGVWLGSVDGPRGFRVTDIGSDEMAGLWRDELDVEHALVFEIMKPR